jgi:RNA recognition motif-containing protein
MIRKLYVRHLPYEIGENDRQDLFARAGAAESANGLSDQMTGDARGFAFVGMSSDEQAQQATPTLNAVQLGGRNLTVNEAHSKAACGADGGGSGGQGARRRSDPRW